MKTNDSHAGFGSGRRRLTVSKPWSDKRIIDYCIRKHTAGADLWDAMKRQRAIVNAARAVWEHSRVMEGGNFVQAVRKLGKLLEAPHDPA